MTLTIRQFETKDTDAVIQLANKYAFFDGSISEENLSVTSAFTQGFIVAEENKRIVGFIYGYFKDVPAEVLANWGVAKVATIELLVVDPQYRDHGIGTGLLNQLIEVFRKAGTGLIGLHCPVSAIEAKQLYEKAGFETSAFHMRKRLV